MHSPLTLKLIKFYGNWIKKGMQEENYPEIIKMQIKISDSKILRIRKLNEPKKVLYIQKYIWMNHSFIMHKLKFQFKYKCKLNILLKGRDVILNRLFVIFLI